MNKIKNFILFRIISLSLIITFIFLDISYAYPPDHNAGNSTLSAPSLLQNRPMTEGSERSREYIFSQSSILASIFDIGEYFFGRPERYIEALPSKYAEEVVRTGLGKVLSDSGVEILNIVPVGYLKRTIPEKLKNALGEIDFKGSLPDEGVVFILYRKNGKRFLVQIAKKDEVSAVNLPGYEWSVSDKYVVKYIPEDYELQKKIFERQVLFVKDKHDRPDKGGSSLSERYLTRLELTKDVLFEWGPNSALQTVPESISLLIDALVRDRVEWRIGESLPYNAAELRQDVMDTSLKFALNEILTNAFDAYARSNTEGPIRLSVTKDPDKGQLIIEVSDNGVGIGLVIEKPGQLSVFSNPSPQGHIPNLEGGRGMGLRWAKIAVGLHGGSLEILRDNYKDFRTTIRMTLPAGAINIRPIVPGAGRPADMAEPAKSIAINLPLKIRSLLPEGIEAGIGVFGEERYLVLKNRSPSAREFSVDIPIKVIREFWPEVVPVLMDTDLPEEIRGNFKVTDVGDAKFKRDLKFISGVNARYSKGTLNLYAKLAPGQSHNLLLNSTEIKISRSRPWNIPGIDISTSLPDHRQFTMEESFFVESLGDDAPQDTRAFVGRTMDSERLIVVRDASDKASLSIHSYKIHIPLDVVPELMDGLSAGTFTLVNPYDGISKTFVVGEGPDQAMVKNNTLYLPVELRKGSAVFYRLSPAKAMAGLEYDENTAREEFDGQYEEYVKFLEAEKMPLERGHDKAVDTIAESVLAGYPGKSGEKKVFVLAIDGNSGAIKTTTAEDIVKKIEASGRKALLISRDWFIDSRKERYKRQDEVLQGSKYGYSDNELSLMSERLKREIFERLRQFNESGDDSIKIELTGLYDENSGELNRAETITVERGTVVVIEGNYLLDGRWEKYIDLGVMMLAKPSIGITRRLPRDTHHDKERIRKVFWRINTPSFLRYLQSGVSIKPALTVITDSWGIDVRTITQSNLPDFWNRLKLFRRPLGNWHINRIKKDLGDKPNDQDSRFSELEAAAPSVVDIYIGENGLPGWVESEGWASQRIEPSRSMTSQNEWGAEIYRLQKGPEIRYIFSGIKSDHELYHYIGVLKVVGFPIEKIKIKRQEGFNLRDFYKNKLQGKAAGVSHAIIGLRSFIGTPGQDDKLLIWQLMSKGWKLRDELSTPMHVVLERNGIRILVACLDTIIGDACALFMDELYDQGVRNYTFWGTVGGYRAFGKHYAPVMPRGRNVSHYYKEGEVVLPPNVDIHQGDEVNIIDVNEVFDDTTDVRNNFEAQEMELYDAARWLQAKPDARLELYLNLSDVSNENEGEFSGYYAQLPRGGEDRSREKASQIDSRVKEIVGKFEKPGSSDMSSQSASLRLQLERAEEGAIRRESRVIHFRDPEQKIFIQYDFTFGGESYHLFGILHEGENADELKGRILDHVSRVFGSGVSGGQFKESSLADIRHPGGGNTFRPVDRAGKGLLMYQSASGAPNHDQEYVHINEYTRAKPGIILPKTLFKVSRAPAGQGSMLTEQLSASDIAERAPGQTDQMRALKDQIRALEKDYEGRVRDRLDSQEIIRTLQFNILHVEEDEAKAMVNGSVFQRQAELIEDLKSQDFRPHLITVSEATDYDAKDAASGMGGVSYNAAEQMAESLGYESYRHKTFKRPIPDRPAGFYHQVAILIHPSLKVIKQYDLRLPYEDSLLGLRLKAKDGSEFLVFTTQLAFLPWQTDAREEQLAKARAFIDEVNVDHLPVILQGDFNMSSEDEISKIGSGVLRGYTDSYGRLNPGSRGINFSREKNPWVYFPDKRLDMVYSSSIEPVESRLVMDSPPFLSDHFAILTDFSLGRAATVLTDGVKMVPLEVDKPDTYAKGEAFVIDLDRTNIVQSVEDDLVNKDLEKPASKDNSKGWGRTVKEMVEASRDREDILLAFNTIQGDFWDANSAVIIDGKLIAKPPQAKGVFQKVYAPLEGRFWVLSFDKENKGIFELEIKDGKLPAGFKVKNGVLGPPLIISGKKMLDELEYGSRPAVKGNQVNWPRDQRMAMSAMGYNKEGMLVRVALGGNADDKVRREITIDDLVAVLERLDVRNALLMGTSADVQTYNRFAADKFKLAKPRAGSFSADIWPDGRPIGCHIRLYSDNSLIVSRQQPEDRWINGAREVIANDGYFAFDIDNTLLVTDSRQTPSVEEGLKDSPLRDDFLALLESGVKTAIVTSNELDKQAHRLMDGIKDPHRYFPNLVIYAAVAERYVYDRASGSYVRDEEYRKELLRRGLIIENFGNIEKALERTCGKYGRYFKGGRISIVPRGYDKQYDQVSMIAIRSFISVGGHDVREEIVEDMKRSLRASGVNPDDFDIRLGGDTTINITKKGMTKRVACEDIVKRLGGKKGKVLAYFGDEWRPGKGTDSEVAEMDDNVLKLNVGKAGAFPPEIIAILNSRGVLSLGKSGSELTSATAELLRQALGLIRMRRPATGLFDIVEYAIVGKRAEFIRAGNNLIGSVDSVGPVNKNMTTDEIKQKVGRAIAAIESLKAEEIVPEARTAIASLKGGLSQFEADGIIGSLIAMARRAKREDQKLIIGLETEWIPGISDKNSLQKNAITVLMKEIDSIGEALRSMGLDNVEIVRGSSTQLAGAILSEAGKTKTMMHNIIVMASANTINSDSFSVFRNAGEDDRPFLAGIDPSELVKLYEQYGESVSSQLYIRLSSLLCLTLELAAGKEPPQTPIIVSYDRKLRIVIFMPKAEPVDYEILRRIYMSEKTALQAA